MALEMIEVAALEVLGKIKHIDASFTWKHPTEDYYINATFVTTEDGTPYLFYCPRSLAQISLTEEIFESGNCRWFVGREVRELILEQKIHTAEKYVSFYLIPLEFKYKPKEISKQDIEKMFDIKVVD